MTPGVTGTYTQQRRLLSIQTPLGPDKLLLRSFSGREAISQLFEFRLELVSEDPEIDFDQVVGQNVTVGIILSDDVTESYINGFVSRFAQLPDESRFGRYEAVIVPWLWFLTRTTDCKIFQNETVPQIVQQVFESFGFIAGQDFDLQLQSTYKPWEYCVQYRETACNFVMRLMEQEGIFFFFEHANGSHTLVLGDNPAVHKPCPYLSTIEYEYARGPGKARDEDMIRDWRIEHEIRPGKYTLNDYEFKNPAGSLIASTPSVINQGGNGKYEIYDYPGEYETVDEGDTWSMLRMAEEECRHIVVTGQSDCRFFASGFRFTLSGFERTKENTIYLLTSVVHSGQEGGFYSGEAQGPASYSNSFTCIPWSVPFRPPIVTPRPLVQGSQTAVVVGPAGNEIYTDSYGRVKVQFHWDRYGTSDQNSSCWIRVATPWAGKQWGAIHIPRIGQEVVVDFLEGDPDRPIITGSVYNARQMPPYSLPAQQTRSTFKSCSSIGGGGFNEIRFEDQKGKEQVFVHAQRNLDVRVGADRMASVGGDCHLTVGGIAPNGQPAGDSKSLVYKDEHRHVKGDAMALTEGDSSEIVGGDAYEWFQSSHRETVANEEFVEAPTIVFEGGQTISLSAPTIIFDASQMLSLKGPGGFIVIDASGTIVQGNMVNINSGAGQPLSAVTAQIGGGPIGNKAKAPAAPVAAANAKPGQPSNT